MKRSLKVSLICMAVVCGFGVATFLKDFENKVIDKGSDTDGTSTTIDQSKRRGLFLVEVNINPMHVEWNGISVDFNSAWIEKRTKTIPIYVWWKQILLRPDYSLVVRCKNGTDALLEDRRIFLYLENFGRSFAMHGTDSFDDTLSEGVYEKGIATVYLRDDVRKETMPVPIVLSWSQKKNSG